MNSITPADLKKLAKKKGVKKVTRMTSKEYNELLRAKGQSKGTKRVLKSFSFTYSIDRYTFEGKEGYEITLKGRHYSKNDTNSFSRRELIRYSKAIHKAAEEFALLNRKFIKSLVPFQKAEVEYVFFNPRSRDHDNNSQTIKHFQDTFTNLRLIIDDKRKNLSQPKEVGEIKSKEYMAKAFLLPMH